MIEGGHMHMSQDQMGGREEEIVGTHSPPPQQTQNYRCFGFGSLRFLQPGFASVQIQAAVLQDPSLFLRENTDSFGQPERASGKQQDGNLSGSGNG